MFFTNAQQPYILFFKTGAQLMSILLATDDIIRIGFSTNITLVISDETCLTSTTDWNICCGLSRFFHQKLLYKHKPVIFLVLTSLTKKLLPKRTANKGLI